jgi:hypothetical protein
VALVCFASLGSASPAIGQAIQCVAPNATSVSTASTGSSNFGVYEWDEHAQAWILLEARFENFAETEVRWADDYFYPATTFSSGSGGSGGSGGGDYHQNSAPPSRGGRKSIIASCVDAPTLPEVLVTGPRPASSSLGSFRLRMGLFRAIGGSGSGIGRRAPNVVSNKDDVNCSLIEELRISTAKNSLAQQFPLSPVGTIFTVRFSNGQSQMFRLNSRFDTLGVGPVSECR